MSKQIGTYDLETGEVLNPIVINDLADIQRNKRNVDKRKSDDEFKAFIDETYGNFYFLFYKLIGFNIEKQYIIRFLYICTYMDYENNLLFGSAKGDNKYMTEKDLKEVLKLSDREIANTKKALIQNELIKLDDNKRLSVNEKYCLKGKIPNNRNGAKVRIFEDGFKELYEKSKPKEHKKLAMLIQLLPYVNLKYNIICEDATCESIELIAPMDMKRICEIVEYDCSNSSRLKKELLSMRVNNELVVMFNETDVAKFIIINPRIYYKGTKVEDVSGIANLFKVTKI